MNTVLTYDAHRNECRMRRLRAHYMYALTQREHTALVERGEAIRREWHARPIPEHRALIIISQAAVQAAPVAVSPCDAAILAPRLPASEQQAPDFPEAPDADEAPRDYSTIRVQ